MAVRILRARPEPMSKVDTAWLRMERPTNLMMITGVLMLASPLDVPRFRRLVEQRFLAYRRFRQKVLDTPGGAFWQDDPKLDMEWHVQRARLPGKGGKAELERVVSRLASTALDHDRPLWQFHVVDGYDGASALITRIHHCYADGIALVQVLLSLTDARPTRERHEPLAKVWFKHEHEGVMDRLLHPTRKGLERALHLGEQALASTAKLLADPVRVGKLIYEGSEITRELATALSLPEDPETRYRGTLSGQKRVAWAEPLPLADVKAVSRALGCTVNDILLASVAGALRHYLLAAGDDADGLTIRATVPVNLRPLEHAKRLGNRFGLVFLELPIGEPNPMRRLELVAANMRALKRSRQAIVAFGLLAALGMGPAALQGPALEMFSRKASAVATNVPGPQMPLYLAGSRIASQMFWVPQTGSIGLGISILSYDGAVYFGLIADRNLVPDPGKVIERFAPEFEKLLFITLMEEWGPEVTADAAQALLDRYCPAKRSPRRSVKLRRARKLLTPAPPGSSFAEALRKTRELRA